MNEDEWEVKYLYHGYCYNPRLHMPLIFPEEEVKLTPVDPNDPTDQGLCGISVAESGTWDPSYPICEAHDAEYNRHKEGLPNDGIVDTTADFAIGEGKTFLQSLYGVVTAPLYTLLVITIGVPLWIVEGLGLTRPKLPEEPPSDDLGPHD